MDNRDVYGEWKIKNRTSVRPSFLSLEIEKGSAAHQYQIKHSQDKKQKCSKIQHHFLLRNCLVVVAVAGADEGSIALDEETKQ